ncbi:MAG: mechanosensitive ion channel [Gammaproteobacteria bacterium]|nr:mechanosensitive ion channel [Gammaproteobacteria bacterium]NNF62552.1 mechanosensitive ion channel family protein [Gammaproteobacteria bacterium]NNM20745.1 mechanosensitive ion channel family protein [Gammaproteobacteria bacterium]
MMALAVSAVFAAQTFDPDLAQTELDALSDSLSEDSASIQSIHATQQRTAAIRTQALNCARNGEELVEQLRTDLLLLGEATAEDPAEILEQRASYEVEIRRSEARAGACRLMLLRTEQILDRAATLQAQLNTQRLTEPGMNGLSAVARLLRDPAPTLATLKAKVSADPRLRGISSARWLLVALISVAAGITGWLLRRALLDWCDRQRGRAGKPTVPVTLVRRVSENAPLLLGGAVASVSLAVFASAPRGDSLLFRLAVAVLLYALGRSLINWITGSFSPGTSLLSKGDYGDSARTRLHALLAGVVAGWLAFGPDWLTAVPAQSTFAFRAVLTVYLVAALLWVLRLSRVVPTLRGRLVFIRVSLVLSAVVAIGAELAGFRNLSNFLLLGILSTLFFGFLLWTVTWAMRQGIQGVVSGTNTASYRIRSWLGMRQEERSAELGWLYMVITIALWIGFFSLLIWTWDPTGNAIPYLREVTLLGIEVGGNKIVPKNIFIGVTAFGIIIALTAWLKARLNRRWLRDMGMERHAREALVTVTGYTGFAVAVLTGLTLAGVSLAGMALVFGALGVGIGFGLQNIVNNFVSGLILLFERPIKPGDFVTVGAVEGLVKEVRTRATEIETLDRQNVLVPNSELVSNQVTNWVLRDPHGRLTLKVGVAYGSDTAKVSEILLDIANNHPDVVKSGRTPAPRALFMGFGDSSLDFELRLWIRQIEKRFTVTSELNLAIDAAFREHGIVIPFPQRDVHIYEKPRTSSGDSPAETEPEPED